MSVNSLFSPAGAMDGTLLLAAATTFSFSLAIVVIAIPGLLRKMREGGMVGRDVNKSTKHEVPELGGIAALFGFTISLSIIVGVQKIVGDIAEPPNSQRLAFSSSRQWLAPLTIIRTFPSRGKMFAFDSARRHLMRFILARRAHSPWGLQSAPF